MDATKLQETIDQAMKQAMINWTNSLASTANNTVKGSYQYYASALQPMACQQPGLTVQQPQPVVQQPQPMVYRLQQPASYQLQTLAPSLLSCQPQQSGASAYQPVSYQPSMAIPQQSNYYLPQTLVCHATCQLQQLGVQQLIVESPIVQQPIMQ